MNYTTAVFLINPHIRAVVATYETPESAPRETFKTLDPSIKKGDYVVVPTSTRHEMTVCKIVDVDVDVDFDAPNPMKWVIEKVNAEAFAQVLSQEAEAIQKIKSAEARKKREELAKSLLADNIDGFKQLAIATAGDIPIAE